MGKYNLRGVLEKIHSDIRVACQRSGRQDFPRIVVASKYMSVLQMRRLYELGLHDFGENRVQDLEVKVNEFKGADIHWHFFGHIQTNKLTRLLRIPLYLIHSIDRIELIYAIERRVGHISGVLNCLLEVNFTGEDTKYGFKTEEEAIKAWEYIRKNSLPIYCRGIMAMAPYTEDEAKIRSVFRRARRLKDQLGLQELSMGMSNDYIIAVEEGSTILRLGSIFSKGL